MLESVVDAVLVDLRLDLVTIVVLTHPSLHLLLLTFHVADASVGVLHLASDGGDASRELRAQHVATGSYTSHICTFLEKFFKL